MSIEKRVTICRMIEKMNHQEAYSQRLGLENVSKFCGQIIKKKNVK